MYVVPVDYPYHTATHPFCFEESCPCHTYLDAIAQVKEEYDAGLLTAEEQNSLSRGRRYE